MENEDFFNHSAAGVYLLERGTDRTTPRLTSKLINKIFPTISIMLNMKLEPAVPAS